MEEFWTRRSSGLTVSEAAAAAGIGSTAAHAAVVRAGGVRPRPRADSGRFLSFAEREEIALGLAARETPAAIARRLGRHRSTIIREIHRNQAHRLQPRRSNPQYRASSAQYHANRHRRRPKPAKLATNRELRAQVENWLARKWSPRQIAARLRRKYPNRPEMWVSHETIYQALYVQSRGALRRELTKHLRTGRSLRRPKRRPDQRRSRLKDSVHISQRPAEVADRAVPGHWEADLILGKNLASAIGTLVERTTRFTLLLPLPHGYQPDQVAAAMITAMRHLPDHLRRSLTYDNGKEMARHAQIAAALNMQIYFCDPHSPWQRPTNENTNGLVRQYFPKSTDLSVHSAARLAAVAAELNGRPRQTLGWDTPAERLNQLLLQ
jgi:IS30 family transposase